MRQFFHTTLHPAIYHGYGRRPPFFEGWYFKMVSADEVHRYAVIPGVILGREGHAFVQVLDGVTGASAYHTYSLSDFWAGAEQFDVRIGPNRFSEDRIVLEIDRPEGRIAGEVRHLGVTPWPVSLTAPGIMGWYAWVPKMECYHGVLSLNHRLEGALRIDGRQVDFSRGAGYIEKDWGQSFPSAWVWFQSNHFDQAPACITASVAIIPWVRRSFPGFIIGLWHEGLLYRFATYTGARIDHLAIADDVVTWVVRNQRHRLEMQAVRVEGGLLLGPTRQDMGKRVNETLNATVEVRLSTVGGQAIFSDCGRHAGLEVHGDVDRLSTSRVSREAAKNAKTTSCGFAASRLRVRRSHAVLRLSP